MGVYLADALRRRLARLIEDGDKETAARIEARLAAVEKAEADAQGEDLSKLLKADLVDRAAAAGIDPEGKTKAELVEALQPTESEG